MPHRLATQTYNFQLRNNSMMVLFMGKDGRAEAQRLAETCLGSHR